MRFYNQTHKHYAGIDLHARNLYACVLDGEGKTLVHRKAPTEREAFLRLVEPYRDDLAVACECLFCWYWLADLCAEQKLTFVLGHAYYMKAVHGGKSKNDRIDSYKIAVLLRGGMLPMAYVYPRQMRATRDLLRRRLHFVRKRAELLAHIQNTRTQYNLPPFEDGPICHARNRNALLEHFGDDLEVQMSMAADLALLDTYDTTIHEMELLVEECVRIDDLVAFSLLQTIPGIGKILALTMYYEIHDIRRFPKAGNFLSYCRLVPGHHESNGKIKNSGGRKMGNANLRWAFSEAAVLFLRHHPAPSLRRRLEKKHGRKKALSVLAAKLGRAVYFMLKRRAAFDSERFTKV